MNLKTSIRDEMLLPLADGGIIDFDESLQHISGCETCDYGSQYINNIRILLTKYQLFVEVDKMYEYALTEANLMKLMLLNSQMIQTFTEQEFSSWFVERIKELVNEEENDVKVTSRLENTRRS